MIDANEFEDEQVEGSTDERVAQLQPGESLVVENLVNGDGSFELIHNEYGTDGKITERRIHPFANRLLLARFLGVDANLIVDGMPVPTPKAEPETNFKQAA
jgi:hypothetical protein